MVHLSIVYQCMRQSVALLMGGIVDGMGVNSSLRAILLFSQGNQTFKDEDPHTFWWIRIEAPGS